MVKRLRWFAIASVLVLVMAACGRDSESTDADDGDGSDTTAAAGGEGEGGGGLDAGEFGDLGVICQEAPEGETLEAGSDPGVTADSIQISTFSDPGILGPARSQPGDVRHRRGVHRLVQRARRHQRPDHRPEAARRQALRVPTARHRSLRRGRLHGRRRRRGVRRHRPGRPARLRATGHPRVRGHRGGRRRRPLDQPDPEPRHPAAHRRDEVHGGDVPGLDRRGRHLHRTARDDAGRRRAQQGGDGAARLEHRLRRLVQPHRRADVAAVPRADAQPRRQGPVLGRRAVEPLEVAERSGEPRHRLRMGAGGRQPLRPTDHVDR